MTRIAASIQSSIWWVRPSRRMLCFPLSSAAGRAGSIRILGRHLLSAYRPSRTRPIRKRTCSRFHHACQIQFLAEKHEALSLNPIETGLLYRTNGAPVSCPDKSIHGMDRRSAGPKLLRQAANTRPIPVVNIGDEVNSRTSPDHFTEQHAGWKARPLWHTGHKWHQDARPTIQIGLDRNVHCWGSAHPEMVWALFHQHCHEVHRVGLMESSAVHSDRALWTNLSNSGIPLDDHVIRHLHHRSGLQLCDASLIPSTWFLHNAKPGPEILVC
jgi:hypothetical protein